MIASLGYFAAIMVLFWPLLKGYCLTSGAVTSLEAPFVIPGNVDAVPYVNFWTGDFVQQFAPFQEYQYRAAHQGRFPTWNPFIFMGQPFHANGQSAMLFPANWFYFLINPNRARGPISMMRLWISASALFCLLRKFSLAPTPAFTGGAVWIFSSFNMHWLLWPHSNASLWAPVVLLALEYLLLKPGCRQYAISSLVIAPLFLSGHPGTIYICVYLMGVYTLIRLLGLFFQGFSIHQLLTTLIIVAAATITGLLVASAALVPLIIQIRHSFEFLDVAGRRNPRTDLPWNASWLFLMPEIFGRPREIYPGYYYTGPDNYIEMTLWFGAIAFVLALTSMITTALSRLDHLTGKRLQSHSFLLVFGLATFVLSMMIGFHIWPIYDIVSGAPGAQLTNMRRFFLVTNLAGAILAACGLQQIFVKKDRAATVICTLIALVCCTLAINHICTQWTEMKWRWSACLQAMPRVWGPNWRQLIPSMFQEFAGYRMIAGTAILILGSAVLLCLLFLNYRRREIPSALRYFFAALITLDVFLPAYDFNPIAPLNLAAPPPPKILQTMIQQTGDGRMIASDFLLNPNINMHYGYADVRGYDLPHNQRLVSFFQKLGLADREICGTLSLNRLYPRIEPAIATYLDRTCVRTLLAQGTDPGSGAAITCLLLSNKPESPGQMNWPRIAGPNNDVVVFSNPNSYPRTFFAKTAVAVSNPNDAMNALLDGSVDLRDRSVFETSQSSAPAVSANLARGDTSKITIDDPERIAIDSQVSSPHLLVLEDRMDEGWKVTIDGNPADALTTNYLFRGVFVPAGHHTVEWTYHAPGLEAGVALSAVSVICMVILLIATRFRPEPGRF